MNNKTDTGGIAAGARLMPVSLIRTSQSAGNSQKSLPTIACSETNDNTYHFPQPKRGHHRHIIVTLCTYRNALDVN